MNYRKKAMLMAGALLCLNLSIYSQSISLKMSNVSVKKAMTELQTKSGYSFVYIAGDVDTDRTVSINASQLKDAVAQILKGQNVSYEIQGKNIVIKKGRKQQTVSTKKRTVSGTVKDVKGEPIIGATVVEKGTTNGTITDFDGNYTLSVNEEATLCISYVGYISQECAMTSNGIMKVILQEDSKTLDEVVVVGYGTQRKSDLTGSVNRVNMEDIRNAPNASLTQFLQGGTPGLNIGQVNKAGGAADIQVRGQSTINGSQDVLIVLDGIIYNGTMASINPSDIASVDVLKDASSKAIYGASAANGVLLITTKRGKRAQKPVINFSASFASQSPTVKLHPFNRDQKIKSIYDYYWDQGAYLGPDYVEINPDFDIRSKIDATQVVGYDNGTDYNWADNATQDSYYMDYQVSVSNATDKTNFYISGGYTKQNGYVVNDNFDRKNARINVETQVFNWLKIGTQTFGSFMDYSGASPDLRVVYMYSPLNVPYTDNGDLIYSPNASLTNPFLALESQDTEQSNMLSALAYASIDLPFLKGFNYRVNWGNNYKWEKHFYANRWGSNQNGYAYKNNNSTYDYTIDHILNYKTKIANDHSLDLTAVFGLRSQRYEYTTANGEQYSDLALGYNSLEQAVIQKIGSEAWKEQYLYQMGRINYNYRYKYFFTATLRRDGFSGFSPNNKYALFPSCAVAWTISNEEFFKVPFINNLKLKVSYGENGNLTSRYSTMAKMDGSRSYIFGDGASTANAQFVSSMASNLQWETTKGMNYALDLSLWNSRFNICIEYYNTKTSNLLWNVNIPTITGFSTIPSNIGELSNKGIELSLDADVLRIGDFNWNLGFNFSKNKNRITKLLGDINNDGKEDDLIASGLFIGESINAIYDYNILGLWGLEDEKMGRIPEGTYVGCEKIEDLNNDGKIDAENDRKILGSKDPAYRFSLTNRFTYKNWSLYMLINSVQGGKNGYLGANDAVSDLGNNSGDNMIRNNLFAEIDYWTPANPNAEYRIPVKVPSVTPSYWKDRSFIRLQDICLNYTFDKKLLSKIGIQALSLSLSGKNLFTITKWKGWDPETGDGLVFAYPVMKSYAIGLNLTF